MDKKPRKSEVMESALDVWIYLKEHGGVDTDRYDADLVEEIRARLSLPSTKSFDVLLGKEDISIEDFIVAFFQAVQPYAEMMSDLMQMFEKAGAKQTNHNLAVRFNFDRDIPELSFDLSHFRSWSETWKKVADTYLANLWDNQTIWALNSALRGRNEDVRNPLLRRWLTEYMERRLWPNFMLPAPRSGDQRLDETLARAWRVWETIVRESAKYSMSRDMLNEIAFGRSDESNHEDQPDSTQAEWSPRFLGRIDSDHWAGSLARGAYDKAEAIAIMPLPERRRMADELRSQLEKVLSNVSMVQVTGEALVRYLEEFLNLPIWQHRHELYSAWIGTQILNALDEKTTRIHQVDGSIIFSFSGTHLATADAFEPRLHVWAELRSPLVDPIGKSRKHAIQPDYSLITDPVTSPEASILEVECKQYLRPSTANFSAALIDYAKGRPNAHVVLVNYGPADQSILNKIEPDLRHRTSLIGAMRPGSKSAQEDFRQIIHKVLIHRYGSSSGNEREKINLAGPGQIILSWCMEPHDLDLYLQLDTTDGEVYKVNFSNRGDISKEPWARLDKDVRSGYGPEVIEVANWLDGKYHFAVKNFSNDVLLAGCGASLSFDCGQQHWEFPCPEEGSGIWWSVFTVDTKSGKIESINRIVDHAWEE